MSSVPASWPRPHLQPGGSDALLMYWVPGAFARLAEAPSGSAYRMKALPETVELIHRRRTEDGGAFEQMLGSHFGRDLAEHSPALAQAVHSAPEYVVLVGRVPAPTTLDYLRDAVGLLTWLTDSGGVGVLDWQTISWLSATQWREQLFAPAAPVPHQHVVILTSPEEAAAAGTLWFHTRGLRKFGRPDISVPHVPPALHAAAAELCNRLIEFQALGGLIGEGQAVRMASLAQGMTCHHRGSLDDPDFNNVHVEVRWPHR